MTKKIYQNSFIDAIEELLKKANGQPVTLETVIQGLAGRGYAALLILLSLPFCIPVIPGMSTPFGILIAFIGLRIAFGHHVWLPKKFMNWKISNHALTKVSHAAITIFKKVQFLFRTRMDWLVKRPLLHIVHGCVIAILGIILALPLPIPFTNTLVAYPLLFFGFALLEDDGVALIIAYIMVAACFLFFVFLLRLGKAGINALFQ